MRIRLFVYAVGLAGLAAGFFIRHLLGDTAYALIGLAALLVVSLLSGLGLALSEKGKYEMPASVLFLMAMLCLLGFVLCS